MKTTTTLVLLCALATANAIMEVSYANYFDNDPSNDYPVLVNGPVRAPVAHPASRVSYSNFYDVNPYNDWPMIVENPGIARVHPHVTTAHLEYSNFLDNNPYNDFVVVKRNLQAQTPWVAPVIDYGNFYDDNPFNDYAIIKEGPPVHTAGTTVPTEWDEIEYQTYNTVETVVPEAYPVEHVEVYQPPPIENHWTEFIP